MDDKARVRIAWLFLGPGLAAIGLFFFLPVLAALLLSFSDFGIYALGDIRYAQFVGLNNYFRLFDDPLFWKALGNTLYFLLVGGPLSIAASLGAALLLQSRLVRFRAFFRFIYFAPVVTTLVAVAVVWRYVYHPRFGILNYLLSLFGIAPIDWLGDPHWAMPAIILLAVWKNFGYNMLIFIAGLQNIPGQLYEAASIDGAGWWERFRRITLPMLAPTTVFITIMTVIGYFQLFAEPYVMTQGGPVNSTMSIVLMMYEQGFRWWDMGYAAALAFVLFALIAAASAVQAVVQRRAGP
jgi:multiple sugar transport system permease protein